MMRNFVFILFLFTLTSCGTLSNLSSSISSAREVLGNIQNTYRELKPAIDDAVGTVKDVIADGKQLYQQGAELAAAMKTTAAELKAMERESFRKADKDGDGELDWMERLAYMTMLGGGAAEIARRKMKATQAQFAALTGKVEHERAKRKAAEAG